jgi:hypothetical protein
MEDEDRAMHLRLCHSSGLMLLLPMGWEARKPRQAEVRTRKPIQPLIPVQSVTHYEDAKAGSCGIGSRVCGVGGCLL